MANQRKAGKKNLGCYIDAGLADKMEKSGMNKTEFFEWATVRGLLVRGRITVSEINKMAAEDRVKASTVLMLQKEGLIK